MQNDEEEPDPVKYHIRQLKRLSKQYPASRVLWKELFGVLFQQGSGYSVTDIRACSVDAVRAPSKHAERMRLTAPSMRSNVSDPGAACMELWLAECAAVEALARHVEFELCCGHICKSMTLLRCICEWFSCPRDSCVSPHASLLLPLPSVSWLATRSVAHDAVVYECDGLDRHH